MTLLEERTWSLYYALVRTSLDKSEQLWSTIFPQSSVPRSLNLAHPQTCVQFPNRTSLETLRPSEVVEIRASSRFSWRKVWTGVKYNFSSPHQHVRKIVRKLLIRRVRMWNFTRIGPKTKKVMAFDSSSAKAVWAARLGNTPKRCELKLFLAGIRQAVRR